MAQTQTFNGRRRVRKFFGKIPEVAEMPNLIEVQKASYDQFLMVDEPQGGRPDEGLQAVFKSVFPVSDFSGAAMLEFVKYEFEPPKFDVEECRQRDLTYSAPLKVTLRLIVFDIDEDTQAKSIKDIKEQDVYMGDMPLMTDNGTFIINGTERVIVSQMHRSPGVFFDHDKGKSHSSGKLLFAARVIPYRGSWLDIEFDAKDIVHARIDRRRKIPVTSLLMALGMDSEEILDTFYNRVTYRRDGDLWRVPFSADRMRGLKVVEDIIDADTGKVVIEAGKKVTARMSKQLAEGGLKAIRAGDEDLYGAYLAEDIVDMKDGRIYGEAGDELTTELLAEFKDRKVKDFTLLDIDHGTYPFVTSSNCVAGAAAAGAGVGPNMLHYVLGITKAYTTRVGSGPFPTELYDAESKLDPVGKHLATKGNEFGSTTGRARRCGWFDAAALKRSIQINGVSGLCVTKLDVLDGVEEVKLCVGYQLDGQLCDILPVGAEETARCVPVYESLPGWKESTVGVKAYDALPATARAYLKRIEEVCAVPVDMISTGPDRDETIVLRHPFK